MFTTRLDKFVTGDDYEGCVELIKKSKNPCELVNLKPKDENSFQSLLHASITCKDFRILELLLQQGADVTFVDSLKGETAFLRSACHLRMDMCELLLKYKSDLNAVDLLGFNALYKVINVDNSSDKEIVKNIEFLVKKGILINSQGKDGNTPLHRACIKLNLLAVEALYKANVNDTILNNEGLTAIAYVKK